MKKTYFKTRMLTNQSIAKILTNSTDSKQKANDEWKRCILVTIVLRPRVVTFIVVRLCAVLAPVGGRRLLHAQLVTQPIHIGKMAYILDIFSTFLR